MNNTTSATAASTSTSTESELVSRPMTYSAVLAKAGLQDVRKLFAAIATANGAASDTEPDTSAASIAANGHLCPAAGKLFASAVYGTTIQKP